MRSPNCCGRDIGTPRMSSVVQMPSRSGCPQAVLGGVQCGFLRAAALASAEPLACAAAERTVAGSRLAAATRALTVNKMRGVAWMLIGRQGNTAPRLGERWESPGLDRPIMRGDDQLHQLRRPARIRPRPADLHVPALRHGRAGAGEPAGFRSAGGFWAGLSVMQARATECAGRKPAGAGLPGLLRRAGADGVVCLGRGRGAVLRRPVARRAARAAAGAWRPTARLPELQPGDDVALLWRARQRRDGHVRAVPAELAGPRRAAPHRPGARIQAFAAARCN